MKRKLISLILSFVLILSIVPAVNADTVNLMSAVMNPDDGTITISGYSSQRHVPIYILQKGKTAQDFKSDRSVLLNMLQAQTDNDGVYTITTGYEGYTECTVCVAVGDSYSYKNVSETNETTGSGLGNIFHLPEKFSALVGDTTKERFQSTQIELPDEMPLYTPMEISGLNCLYVSPGATGGDGSEAAPYGLLSQAVTRAKQNPMSTVIYLREGTYGADQTIALENVEASSEFPLMISAYPGEEVVFTGGVSLKRSDFKKISDKDILERLPMHAAGVALAANLKELGITNYGAVGSAALSADGVKYTLARYPDVGTTGMIEYTGTDGENGVIDSGSITTVSGSTCGAPRPNGIKGEPGFEICVADTRPFEWVNTDEIYVTGSFYEEWSRDTARVKAFNADTQSIRTYTGASWGAKYNAHNGFYYYNILEEMNKPGEWFVDRTTGMLYLYPHAEFESVNFGNNTKVLITLKNSKNIVINGIKFKDSTNRAININNCENVLIQNCDFEGNKAGVDISGNSKFCGVINSVFANIAGNPISMQHPSVTSEIAVNLLPQYNFFQNNYVYNCDSVLTRGNANIISHNVVSNSKGTGIYSDRGHEIIIEYNIVAYGNTEVADSGPIYVGGNRLASGGNHVRYNYIYKCKENRNSTYGIYFDDFMSRSFIYGNIMEDTRVFLHNGSDNTVYNNVFVNVPAAAIADSKNYMNSGFNQRWLTGALNYGAFTEFLDPTQTGVYIDVVSDDSAYAIRYPALQDWAIKMQQRIEEFNKYSQRWPNLSFIYISYPSGTRVSLDKYLRTARFNYYENNLMINCTSGLSVTDEGKVSAEIANNVTTATNPFTSGYNKEGFDKVRASHIAGFEDIPVDRIGIVTDMPVVNKKPTVRFPANEQIVEPEELAFSWISNPGNTVNTLKISASKDMTNPVITKTIVGSDYVLTDADKAILTEGMMYYWQVEGANKTAGVTNSLVKSDVYSFIINNENLEYTSGGVLVYSIKNASNENVTDIAKEAALTVCAFAYNKGNKNFDNVTVYAAGYGENDKLLSVKTIPVGIIGASSFTEDLIFNLTNTEGAQKIKLFMWDNNMKPLSDFEEVK